jgi:hypothetical protein
MKTAVEWLVEELKTRGHALITTEGVFINVPNELIEEAKSMEKEQIMDAWIATDNELQRLAAEKYYNETYLYD